MIGSDSAEGRGTPPVVLLHLQPQPREHDKTACEQGGAGQGREEGREQGRGQGREGEGGPQRQRSSSCSSSSSTNKRATETETHLAHTMLPLEMKFAAPTKAQGPCEQRRHNTHADAATRAGAQGGGDSSRARGCHEESDRGGGEGVGEAGGGGEYTEESSSRVYKLSVIILRTGHQLLFSIL
jgi:hypothetical protein